MTASSKPGTGDLSEQPSTPAKPSETLKLKVLEAANLSQLSVSELILLLEMIAAELKNRQSQAGQPLHRTDRLSPDVPAQAFIQPRGIREADFKVLPERLAADTSLHKHDWKFVLTLPGQTYPPIPIRAVSDVVVGRGEEGVNPDLDLGPYQQGAPRSISRVHAVIRPGESQLTLTDLGSTNGTFVDGEKLTPGRPVALRDQMTLTFGKTHLRIQIIERPGSPDKE